MKRDCEVKTPSMICEGQVDDMPSMNSPSGGISNVKDEEEDELSLLELDEPEPSLEEETSLEEASLEASSEELGRRLLLKSQPDKTKNIVSTRKREKDDFNKNFFKVFFYSYNA